MYIGLGSNENDLKMRRMRRNLVHTNESNDSQYTCAKCTFNTYKNRAYLLQNLCTFNSKFMHILFSLQISVFTPTDFLSPPNRTYSKFKLLIFCNKQIFDFRDEKIIVVMSNLKTQ